MEVLEKYHEGLIALSACLQGEIPASVLNGDLEKTKEFYKKYGNKTIVLARFVPIIRTFAPFVAGVGTMKYRRFLIFCIIGNLLWVNIFSFAGYFFGNIPAVKRNFSFVVFAIIFVSFIPPIYTFMKQLLKKKDPEK